MLAVLYLLFNEANLATSGAGAFRRDLADDAAWLCTLVCQLLPGEPEPLGLLALMKLHIARGQSRSDDRGELVLLADQDRSRWDREAIVAGGLLIARAAGMGRPGPYQLEAAIAACHAEAPSFAETDWAQVLALYDMLLTLVDSPVTRLNRAVVLWQLDGPEAALLELQPLAAALEGYHLFHAARGVLLTDLGRSEQARAEHLRAFQLTGNQAERSVLQRRLFS